MDKALRHHLFLINSGSGSERDVDWNEVLETFFKSNPQPYQVLNMGKKIDVPALRREIMDQNPKSLVAVGGDGTVSLAANVIAGTDILLGIIPQGSANGMAKELAIPEDIQEALEIITADYSKPCDLISIKDHCLCLHMADVGLNAQLIKHFDEGNKRGLLGYALVIFKTLWRKRKINIKFVTDGVQNERTAFMIALANASKYGTGAVINPEGVLDDGLFEVVVVRHLDFLSLMKMLFKPGLFNPEKIEIFKTKHLQLSSRHKMHFQIDGEYKGQIKTLEAHAQKSALKVLVKNDQGTDTIS